MWVNEIYPKKTIENRDWLYCFTFIIATYTYQTMMGPFTHFM